MAMAWRMWSGRAEKLLAREASSEGMAGASAGSVGITLVRSILIIFRLRLRFVVTGGAA